MKAISIRQPWAWSILELGKTIENRPRRLNYRGDVLIHASKRPPYRQFKNAIEAITQITGKHPNSLPNINSDKLHYGGVIGMATIVDCVDHHDSPWFFGPFGYVLENIRAVPFYPTPGQLGLFNIDTTIEDLTRPPQRHDVDPARTMGDLRMAGRRVIINCNHCRSTTVKDAREVAMPAETLITEAHKLRPQCGKCQARWSISIKAEPLEIISRRAAA